MNWYNETVRYVASEGMIGSDKWKEIVTSFEGLRLKAYDDGVGVWTIGYGHTLGVKRGDVITEARADELLRKDVARFEAAVNRLVTVPLTQYQFDALTSFTFNLGSGNLASSTLLKKINAGDYSAAADEILRWNRAGGKVWPGLVRRRKAERTMFKGGDWLNA